MTHSDVPSIPEPPEAYPATSERFLNSPGKAAASQDQEPTKILERTGTGPIAAERDDDLVTDEPRSPSSPGQQSPVSTGEQPVLQAASRPIDFTPFSKNMLNSDFESPGWVLPGAVQALTITEGPNRGRLLVGEGGGLKNAWPTVWGVKFAGGHRPSDIVDAGYVGQGAYMAAASVRGTRHHVLGTPRQDHYALGVEENWLFIAIADGVSSGLFSHLAAEAATRAVVNQIRSHLVVSGAHVNWVDVGNAARQAVRRTALQVLVPKLPDGALATSEDVSDELIIQHMATTCDAILVHTEPTDEGQLEVTRVSFAGDGSCYLLDPRDGWYAVDRGHGTQAEQILDFGVSPLPRELGPPRVTPFLLERGQAVVLCSDGIEDLVDTGASPVGRYLFRAWGEPCSSAKFLESMTVVNQNGEDDRTAVVVWAISGSLDDRGR